MKRRSAIKPDLFADEHHRKKMVRILVLKRLYNLSDEQMEYPLLDRMSYKRFCGLADATHVPDRTTVLGLREPNW